MDNIMALSVLDGRYKKLVQEFGEIFSEYGLIRHRVYVEVQWLKFLINELKLAKVSGADFKKLDKIASDFDITSAKRVKEIEHTTNHDVKAVEYYIKEQLDEMGLSSVKEWVHFSCKKHQDHWIGRGGNRNTPDRWIYQCGSKRYWNSDH